MVLPAVATYDLSLGQADLLVAALAVGAEGLRLRRQPLAPLALGAAIAIKPLLLPLLVVWLWKGDRRAALQGLGAAAALLLLPFLLVGGIAALHDYLVFLTSWNAFAGSASYINQSLYGGVLRALGATPGSALPLAAASLVSPLRYGLVLAAAGCWLWSVPRRVATDSALALGEYLLALPLLLLASPLSEDIHYCLLIPALVGLAWLAARRGWRQPESWLLWGCLVVFCVPRMQELIYPTHLLLLPGQRTPVLGPAITLLRGDLLCLIAVVTLLAGGVALRGGRGAVRVGLVSRRGQLGVRAAPALATTPAEVVG